MDVYSMVTERIINQLEKGEIPWKKPWAKCLDGTFNRITRKPYSLLNKLLLLHGGEYATFKQWEQIGGRVKNGEKSEIVVFWKLQDLVEKDENGNIEMKQIPLLRYYNVFHISQVNNVMPLIRTEDFGTKPIERAETILHEYLNREHITLSAEESDRAFYTRLCEGVTERKIYLDYILDHYSKTPMKKCKPLIRSLLRMGAYQILFMDVRDAAACSEAVSLAKKRGFGRLSGFVNGVLRTLVREKENLPVPDKKDDVKYVSITYSVPEWLSKLIIEQYGKESAEKIFASFLEARPLTIRTNLSKTTPEELEKELEEAGVKVEKGNYLPYAFTISNLNYLGKIAAFRQGKFAVQDESSQLAVAIADINEGDFVLDVCAAPGGKTFHAADRLKGAGKVLSRDLTEYKTELIEENKDRMHYENVEVQQWDALEEDESLLESVDVLLADLPCSGLGIMGRKNDIKYQMTEEQLGELAALQRQILSVVWKYVKPGGQMIFSTCTLNKGENAENIKWIEENTPLHLVSIEEYLPQNLKNRTGSQGYLQLIPGEDTCDGFFISKFKRPEAK